MDRSISVLILEDNSADAELMIHELKRVGFDPVCRCVETEADFVVELEVKSDIILADFSFPDQFDALRALSILKDTGRDIPMIVVTGVLGDEAAVECMKEGAADYLIKDRLARLGPAVIRALEQRQLRDQTRRAEEQLRRSQRELSDFFENANVGLVCFGADGVIQRVNRAALKILDKPRESVIGREFATFLVDRSIGDKLVSLLAQDEPVTACEAQIQVSGDDPKQVLIDATGFWDDGRFVHSRCFIRDITRRKRIEEQLTHVNELLADKNAKLHVMAERAHRFVDDVSHEFRTPLTVIKEFVSIISDGLAGEVTPKQDEYLKIVEHAVLDLNQMVEDFLDSSKLRAGSLRINRQRHDISAILDAARPTLQRKASSRNITIEEDITPDLCAVYADEEKVRRVLTNMATNAIKFSPANESVKIWARPHSEGGVEIGVTDHGPGIGPEQLQQLFDRFRLFSPNRDPSIKGFGLGLNIAKEMTWLNLGRINVASRRGDGATFSFTMPPDDPAIIVDHFLNRLADGPNKDAPLAVVKVSTHGNRDNVQSFLADTTWPTDVILPAEDDSTLVIFGPCREPNLWVGRLEASVRRAVDDAMADEIGHFELSLVEVLPSPDDREAVATAVLTHIHGVPACV